MAKYKVDVLGVLGINKKKYKANDIVEDKNFPEGVAKELCKKGYLISLEKGSEDKKLKAAEKAVDEAADNYRSAQVALKELEEKQGKESDAEKKKEFDPDIAEAKTALKEAEKALNDAKAKLKGLQ